jgi:hypothetical protein
MSRLQRQGDKNQLLLTASFVSSSPIFVTLMMGGDMILRNVGSYKSHEASYPKDGILQFQRSPREFVEDKLSLKQFYLIVFQFPHQS